MNTSSTRTLFSFFSSSSYFSFICDEDSSSLIRYPDLYSSKKERRGAGFMILSLRVFALFPSHHLSIMGRGNHLLHANH